MWKFLFWDETQAISSNYSGFWMSHCGIFNFRLSDFLFSIALNNHIRIHLIHVRLYTLITEQNSKWTRSDRCINEHITWTTVFSKWAYCILVGMSLIVLLYTDPKTTKIGGSGRSRRHACPTSPITRPSSPLMSLVSRLHWDSDHESDLQCLFI